MFFLIREVAMLIYYIILILKKAFSVLMIALLRTWIDIFDPDLRNSIL